jgi:hypothetical protein
VGASTADVQAERNFSQVNPTTVFTTIGDEVAKSKNKKSLKKLDKEYRKLLIEARKETRLDTLRGLQQMLAEGITIDAAALDELISDVEGATVPVNQLPSVEEINLTKAGENVWVPKVDDGEVHTEFYSVGPLADTFGVSKQTLTKFLRENFPDDAPGVGSSWRVTPEMADAFASR